MRAQTGTQAVDRAATLLVGIIDAERPLRFRELMTSASLPKSTTSRLLGALERQGLVQRHHDGGFRPGPVLARYLQRGGTADLVAVAQPHLERLGARTGETVNLAVPGQGCAKAVAQVDGRYLIGGTNWVGASLPLHCSALGKIFLAFGVAKLPSGPLEARTERTITSPEALTRDLGGAAGSGWAVSRNELERGLVAVAAPVRARDGVVVAAVSVTGPAVRLTPERSTALGSIVKEEARALSAALGHRPRKEGAA